MGDFAVSRTPYGVLCEGSQKQYEERQIMAWYHKACSECVIDGQCFMQDSGDVEECSDVQEFEQEESE